MKCFSLSCMCLLFACVLKAQVTNSFMFEGANRSYLVYVPGSLPPGNPAPVVMVLHGFTQTAQNIMSYSGFNTVAENEGFIAVYPNGINLSWNVGFSPTGANDVGFLNALIDTLNAKYNIDLDRVYACGMSNGGFMSYRLACELSPRIAAIASVSGSMTSDTYGNCQPERPIPVMEIHGTSDLIVNYGGAAGIKSVADVIGYWAHQNECPEFPEITLLPDVINEGSRVERSVYTPCAQYSEVVLMKVLDGGHTWPGCANSGIGTINRDIHASREIWSFFKRFSLSGNPNPTKEGDDTFNIHVFPNPASKILQIAWSEEYFLNGASLRLLNHQGQIALQQPVSMPVTGIFVGALPAGMYIVEVHQEDKVVRKRVIIN